MTGHALWPLAAQGEVIIGTGKHRARPLPLIPALLAMLILAATVPTTAQAAVPSTGTAATRSDGEETAERTVERWMRQQLGEGEFTAMAAIDSSPDELLANVYRFHPHPSVELSETLRWSENPLGSDNWLFQFHSLRWAKALGRAWDSSGDPRYLDRYEQLLRSWLAHNPRSAPASPYAWNDHSTAWRALTLVDFASYVPMQPWLRDALVLHGQVLADEDFYRRDGNHALNQNLGLLAVGCTLPRQPWIDLARDRLDTLVVASVDEQGVTDEQAVEYQHYNYERYTEARWRLEGCGQSAPEGFDRVRRMPEFLAHATLPNGEYVLLGDTEARPASIIVGTVAEYAATQGVSGPMPGQRAVAYDAGYVFGRSGWGEERPFADETAYSVRFGPPRRLHGHLDHAAVTLYAHGARLLLDRGKYAYGDDPYRDHVTGRSAHNVVTVDGLAFDPRTTTKLSAFRHDPQRDHVVVRHEGYAGVTHQRRVVFSRTGGYLLVHDELSADRQRRFRQLWQLPPDGNPQLSGADVRSRRDGANVLLRQLATPPEVAVAAGQRNPLLGWQSYSYGQIEAAPTVEAVLEGSDATYLTLIVPLPPGSDDADVHTGSVRWSPNGFRAVVTVDGRREGVTVDGTSASVVAITTPLTDTFDTVFHADIEQLHGLGITGGVTRSTYQPAAPVTRAQMATFLQRVAAQAGAPLEDPGTDQFTDIAGTAHRSAIRAVASAGITQGTGDGSTFRPQDPVTRGQMASFIARLQAHVAGAFPNGVPAQFADIAGNVHADSIGALAAAGITQGTGNGMFDPDASVSRGQMAAFLLRHLRYLGVVDPATTEGS